MFLVLSSATGNTVVLSPIDFQVPAGRPRFTEPHLNF